MVDAGVLTVDDLVYMHKQITYYTALELVDKIDINLEKGTGYYWNKAGELLTTLDEVVRAILDDDLLMPDESWAVIAT